MDHRDIAVTVHALLIDHASALPAVDELPSGTLLGAEGLGLDSIAIAEVLLGFEERFGIPAAELLEGEPVTFGRLVRRASK